MKKSTILFALFMAATSIAFSQSNLPAQIISGSAATMHLQLINPNDPDQVQQAAKGIMDIIGLQPNFTIKTAKVSNIEAVITHHQRYILYNPEFITGVNNATKDKWAFIFLLSHEIGHHLNGHTLKNAVNRWPLELEADEFAGFVLKKLGATLEQAELVMNYIAEIEASKTHPARADRIQAIANGWKKADTSSAGIATIN
jgi:hypothetical protein